MTTLSPEATAPTAADAGEARPGRRRKLLLVVAVVLVLAVAGWWFVLRPSGPSAPEPGAIVTLDSTQINLAGGHYLKIGIALQLTKGAAEVDGSKALDATIDLFSGLPLSKVSAPADRHALQKKLAGELDARYDGDVMGVYFTEFVTQ